MYKNACKIFPDELITKGKEEFINTHCDLIISNQLYSLLPFYHFYSLFNALKSIPSPLSLVYGSSYEGLCHFQVFELGKVTLSLYALYSSFLKWRPKCLRWFVWSTEWDGEYAMVSARLAHSKCLKNGANADNVKAMVARLLQNSISQYLHF